MPKGKSKKFIDKKNSVTFHLVHRSQKDPLIADEKAPQRVLVPVQDPQAGKSSKKTEDINKRKEEQKKYGIYFDDDYDYLQHLRDVNNLSTVEWERVDNNPKLNLPSSVFASHVEEKVGMLDKAVPTSGLRLDLDPDVIAALDDDFDFDDPDNALEDNFIELANGDEEESNYEDEFCEEKEYEFDAESDQEGDYGESDFLSDDNMNMSEEEKDEVCSLNGPQYTFKDEETKSRFTEYSMSSSVMRRNQQLTLLDDKFEKMYAAYDENEIGALDCDEIEGYVDPSSDLVMHCAEEFEKQKNEDAENITKLMKNKMRIIDREYSSSEDEDDLEKLVVEARERDKWDCESILSTYSNIYNHPKIISEPKGVGKIKINKKTGIPENVLDNHKGKLTEKALAQFNRQSEEKPIGTQSIDGETMKSVLSILSVRHKEETPEERNERKKALKNYRRERRIEKKANILAFKEEKKRQEKIRLNNQQNVQGNRIL
ncbi:protein LTV1 homolog [Prorops nasuta]|uniref:protein LTV1 homolog n=1 Tax=Prorops nasuta TaxID=863751 RepID=UPI0034CFC8FB